MEDIAAAAVPAIAAAAASRRAEIIVAAGAARSLAAANLTRRKRTEMPDPTFASPRSSIEGHLFDLRCFQNDRWSVVAPNFGVGVGVAAWNYGGEVD